MAGFLTSLLFAADRALMFSDPVNWVPGVASIALALLMWAFTFSRRVPLSIVMTVGLCFEVVSSYGIAFAEYLDPQRLNDNGWMGLSWVAVWTLLFTVVIPTRPRKALLAMLASVSSVPVVIGFIVATHRTTFSPEPVQFFFWVVFPYLLTTIMAYVGARVVYTLGKAVTEARELGSYRLVERLGQGGMGEVWRAQHRLLARPAAIKLIRGSGDGDAAVQTRPFADSSRKRRSPQACHRLIPCSSSTSVWQAMAASTTSWNFSMASTSRRSSESMVRCRRSG